MNTTSNGKNSPSVREEIPTFLPRTDVIEGNESLAMYIDLPGVSQEGLDLHFEQNMLTVTGRIESRAPEGLRALVTEGAEGQYQRRFTLSGDFETDKISAVLKDGTLRIELPKGSRQKARKIPIRTQQ